MTPIPGFLLCSLVMIARAVDTMERNGRPLIRDERGSSVLFAVSENLRLTPNPGETYSTRQEASCLSCGMMCSRFLWCFSFNCGIEPTMNGERACELLSTDKYNSSTKLRPSADFHHFSILTPCSASPCHNGGRCIALYETDQFTCVCPMMFTGRMCQQALASISVYVKASGCDDQDVPGNCSASLSSIQVDGVEYSPMNRGHNIVVVNGSNGSIQQTKQFDTHGDPGAATALKNFIDKIQGGSIVLIATQDEGSHWFYRPDVLKTVGAQMASHLEYRGSWCLIGYKGPPKAWIQERIRGRGKGPAVLTATIPIA